MLPLLVFYSVGHCFLLPTWLSLCSELICRLFSLFFSVESSKASVLNSFIKFFQKCQASFGHCECIWLISGEFVLPSLLFYSVGHCFLPAWLSLSCASMSPFFSLSVP